MSSTLSFPLPPAPVACSEFVSVSVASVGTVSAVVGLPLLSNGLSLFYSIFSVIEYDYMIILGK